MKLNFQIKNDHLQPENIVMFPVNGSINHLIASFSFEDEWNECTKTAIFKSGAMTYHVILENDECVIPWEALAGDKFEISVFGIKDDKRLTSTAFSVPLSQSGYCDGGAPMAPSEDLFSQILTKFKEISENHRLNPVLDHPDGSVTMEKLSQEVISSLDSKLSAKADKTQFASINSPGLIKLYSGSGVNRSGIIVSAEDGTAYIATRNDRGIARDGAGGIGIVGATKEEIAAKSNIYKPITPSTIEYAVECATINNIYDISDSQLNLPISCKEAMKYTDQKCSTNYTSSPQKIGTWIDGTPIWRVAFKIGLPFNENTWPDRAINILSDNILNPFITDFSGIIIINSSAVLSNSKSQNIIDCCFCIQESCYIFDFPSMAQEGIHDTIHGFIEFALPEERISFN